MNNDIIHVDPHITHYTVYITDNYTGDVVKVNVTETRFTFSTSEDCSCPNYQVSAWNAGGEGELSQTLQRCRPLGKLSFLLRIQRQWNFVNWLFLYFLVPHKIAAGNINTHTTASQVLHVHLHVSSPAIWIFTICIARPLSGHIIIPSCKK